MPGELDLQLQRYADLIVKVGLNLRPAQRLVILHSGLYGVDVGLAPFVRIVAEAAYRHGASRVDVIWGDALLERMRLQRAPKESLGAYPRWPSAARMEHIEAGDAYLCLRGDDPDLLADIDPQLLSPYLDGIRTLARPVLERMSRNSTNWCVVAVSAPPWANKVLPDVPEPERVSRLWDLVLEACRVSTGDPIENWRMHTADLVKRAAYLNEKQYEWLSYTGAGTRLKVGLPPGHIWCAAQMVAQNGIPFIANLPTEEVFTLPDRGRVEGEVTQTRPFEYGGNSIDGMHLTFEHGKVVKFSARAGEAVLGELLRVDEGSDRLGEVALVPNSSPISRLGVTFKHALFDENAACHLAFGNAYRFTLKEADALSAEEFAQRGGNSSKIHYDFMIGSGSLDVDGLLPGGQSEPIFRAGEWAFKV